MDINKLAEKLSKLNTTKGEFTDLWFKPSEEEQRIRILPYPHQNDPFIEVYFHYNIGNSKSLVCPRAMEGRACPICDLAEEIKAKGGDDNYKIFQDYKAKMRTYVPVLVRGKEEEGVKLWGFGINIYKELGGYMVDPDWGNIADVTEGHDISVRMIPVGKPGNDTRYPKTVMKLKPKKTPLGVDLDEIPNYIENGVFPIKEYAELVDVLRAITDVDEDDDLDDDDFTGNSSGDLSSKLDSLLDD